MCFRTCQSGGELGGLIKMICPGCGSENEIVYSVLSNGLVCLEEGCDFELEINQAEARQILEVEEELVCA
jgi:hypothetical protein